jgi:hypothetical protein
LASLRDFQGQRVGSGVSPSRYKQLMQGWYAHNKRVEKGLPFWATAFWPVEWMKLETLSAAIRLAETSGIDIHYKTLEHTTQFFTFYFKVSSYDQFDTKLDHIREILRLKAWHVIRHPLDAEEDEESPYEKEKSATPHLTHDTIPVFLETIKPYL